MQGPFERFYKAGVRRSLAALIGASTMTWGLLLLNPLYVSFNNPNYQTLAFLAPEPVWGAAIAISGGILVYGAWSGSYWFRKVGFLLCCTVRIFLCLLIGIGNGWTTNGPWDFGWWALGAAVGFLETQRDGP